MAMKSKIVALTGITLIFSLVPDAQANVSLKNGNFFRGYTDIMYQGGFEPKMERVYNSKTSFSGIFGPGWGNEYEVQLSVSADGSVIISEYGGGAENRFTPASMKAGDLDSAVKSISDAEKDTGRFGTQKLFDEYKERLRTDATFRNDEWQILVDQGKIKARELPVGAVLLSNRFAYQTLTRTKDGYMRTYDNGRSERFDVKGRLVRVQDRNGNSIDFSYSKDGRIEKLVDNFNRKMFFSFNSRGRLEKIQGENGKEASYSYNSAGELAQSKDAEGNVYRYKYSSDGQHNLVEIGYADKTALQVEYFGRDKFGSVKSLKERDGARTEYDYEFDPRDKGHITVSVKSKPADGGAANTTRYEYFQKTKSDGEEWTQKMVTASGDERTETTYNECCGLPLSIRRGKDETRFEYDSKGRVVRKESPLEVTELSYDKTAGKVSKVVRKSKSGAKSSSWSEFKYDARGNLELARNSSKKGVSLFYDANGRIRSLIDQDKRRLDFKYNENSKPVEITDPKLGSIRVTYKNSGEIDKIDSSAGQKVAIQVTSAFQNLLEIIRPAGVNLSF
jgi:YD repeat-containing protein